MAKTHFSGNHCAWRGNKAWKEAANIYVNKSNAFCHSYYLPIVNKQLPCKNVHHSVEIYEFPNCVGSIFLSLRLWVKSILGIVQSTKMAILTISKALNFHFGQFLIFLREAEICPKMKFKASKNAKMADLLTSIIPKIDFT